MVVKCDFVQIVQFSLARSQFLANLRSFYSTQIFSITGWLLWQLLQNKFFSEEYFSSLTGLNKKLPTFCQKCCFLQFFTTWLQIHSWCSQRAGQTTKSLLSFLEKVERNFVFSLSLLFFLDCRGTSRFERLFFQKSVISVSCVLAVLNIKLARTILWLIFGRIIELLLVASNLVDFY